MFTKVCVLFQVSDGYVCGACYLEIERKYRLKRSPTRTPGISPKIKRLKSGVPSPTNTQYLNTSILKTYSPSEVKGASSGTYSKPPKSPGLIAIVRALRKYKYYTALRHILAKGEPALVAFNKLVKRTARDQILRYVKHPATLPPKLEGIKSIEDFTWNACLDEWKRSMPTVFAACDGALESKRTTDIR
jgi:hypothetical protein